VKRAILKGVCCPLVELERLGGMREKSGESGEGGKGLMRGTKAKSRGNRVIAIE